MPALFTARCACCRRVRLRCQAPGLVSSRARRVRPPAAAGARRVRPLLLQSRPVPAAGGAQPLRRLLHHGIAGGGVRRRALDQAARLMDRQRHPLRPQGPYSTGCAAAAQRVFNPSVARRWWGSPSATRWSCKPSVARLRVRPTTCQQLHFFRWGTRTGPLPAGNPYGSSVSKMGTKLTPEAQRYFGTNRSGFDLLYHHNDAVTRMPGPAAGLIEMGGNRTTPNNGVFDMRGTVLTFCGHPVRVSLSLLFSPSPCLSPSLFPPPLRPRCLTLCATTTAGLLAPSPRPARAVRDRSRLEVGGGPAARLWHHHLLRRDRL